MTREQLKELGLNDEQIEAVMKAYGQSVNDIKEKADKVEGLESQIEDLQGQIQERDTQLDDLSKKAKDSEELTAEINRLKDENENTSKEMQVKLENQKKSFAIQNALRDANVHDPDLAQKAIDVESISFKDGKLLGLDEQLSDLKENKSFLFKEEEPPGLKGRKPHEGGQNPPPTNKNPFSKEHFNLTEQGRLLKDDPELYKQLQAQANN